MSIRAPPFGIEIELSLKQRPDHRRINFNPLSRESRVRVASVETTVKEAVAFSRFPSCS